MWVQILHGISFVWFTNCDFESGFFFVYVLCIKYKKSTTTLDVSIFIKRKLSLKKIMSCSNLVNRPVTRQFTVLLLHCVNRSDPGIIIIIKRFKCTKHWNLNVLRVCQLLFSMNYIEMVQNKFALICIYFVNNAELNFLQVINQHQGIHFYLQARGSFDNLFGLPNKFCPINCKAWSPR